jgi:hypothetical protein
MARPGRWADGVAAGALEQSNVENALYAATVANGLVADDGESQCWATIRSGLGASLQTPADPDADRPATYRNAPTRSWRAGEMSRT